MADLSDAPVSHGEEPASLCRAAGDEDGDCTVTHAARFGVNVARPLGPGVLSAPRYGRGACPERAKRVEGATYSG